MIQTNRKAINYADNLIDAYLTFDTEQTWTVSSGTGYSETNDSYVFNGYYSLQISNTDPTNDIIITNSTQNTVFARKLDNCALSFYLYKDDASYDYTGNVKIYKNAVLLATETFTLEDSQDENWYRFVSGSYYQFADGDVITFTFQLDGISGHSGTSNLWIDGLMLHVADDRQNGAVPFYVHPNVNGSVPSLPTSDGQYILNVSSGNYTWSDFNNWTGWADYTDDEYSSGSPLSLSATTETILKNNAATIRDTEKPIDITEFYFAGGLVLTGVSGTFVANETITGGTSSATATLRKIDGGDYWYVERSGTFQTSETITGGISGATGTVSTLLDGIITGVEGDAYITTINFTAKPTNAGTSYLEVWFNIGGSVGELYRRIFSFPKGNGVERPVTMSTGVYTLDTWENNGAKVYVESDNTCDIYDIRIIVYRLHKAL